MSTLFDVLNWLTSFILMILAVWLLIIATPLINEIRKESRDPDIHESWQDVRTSINITYKVTLDKIKDKLKRGKHVN